MRSKMKAGLPDVTLTRLLAGLEQELISASDEEIFSAAEELGMNPAMKGSAAFIGLKFPVVPRAEDFFSGAAWGRAQAEGKRVLANSKLQYAAKPPEPALPPKSRQRKAPDDKNE
jgi:hypothetical protein